MQRERIILADGWRFQIDPENAGEAIGYHRAEYDAGRWREISVPCSLERGHPDLEWYMGSGWYRCLIRPPVRWEGRRVVLRFEGANYHSSVWLNGELLGRNEDGFLPFAFAISERLRYGEENTLVVRVDNEARAGEAPGMNVGWRPYGGILREVLLETTGQCYLECAHIVAQPEGGNSGGVSFSAMVHNEGTAQHVVLDTRVVDADGAVIGSLAQEIELGAGQKRAVNLRGEVAGIVPWSPDCPMLYNVQAILRQGTEELDLVQTRFGFRRVEARDGQILLNGQPIYLLGFNRHEDSPTQGMCTDLDTARRDLLDMKALGCNFVRLCHYPHHPGELDLCDELGLLVMGEIPVYGSTGMAEDVPQYRLKIRNARRQLTTMIQRDWNHPAVIFWSVSNETSEERGVVVQGNNTLIRHARTLDPSRLIVHVSHRWDRRWEIRHHFGLDDVICVNGYPWMRRKDLLEEGKGEEAARYWVEHLARMHEVYPEKPILVTEFGARSYAGVLDHPAGEDAHARALETQFPGMTAPYVCGAVVWCYADHAWPVDLHEGYSPSAVSVSPFGVLTRQRVPKAIVYHAIQRLFAHPDPQLGPGA